MGMWFKTSLGGTVKPYSKEKRKEATEQHTPQNQDLHLLSPSEESYSLKKRGPDPSLSLTFNTCEAEAPDPYSPLP